MRRQELHGNRSVSSVSELCLGTLDFGGAIDRATSFALLDTFVEAGGNFVDTANCYNSWSGTGDESELTVGEWLRGRSDQDSLVVATKVGGRPTTPGSTTEFEGLSAGAVRHAVRESLRRLGVDHLKLCYSHVRDESVGLAETLGAFEEQRQLGLLDAIGLSNHSATDVCAARELAKSNGWAPAGCVQQRHSYLQPMPGTSFGPQIPLDRELADYAASESNLLVLGYSPLLSGAYARPDRPLLPHYLHAGTPPRLLTLSRVAHQLGATLNQVVLAWMLHSTPSVVPVIGVSSLDQLNECIEAVHILLDHDHMRELAVGDMERASHPA
ncbi:aldo/keto reductase [Kutzneria buriramensis]|uniref:Aryl-alcohol dehydrogenase-like predicted oxidoreductase n=1 Tax=Kutzneria buriramensis TaxID=1045776 RepID=A0A3E0GVA3_9PSEU|nr:aldo/keto reductase [Kutzneria buriramensis]REH26965.1 aryl-alcohol dehydrogenase-like predicted oxidoreductase [Kutzneria buriramensis]